MLDKRKFYIDGKWISPSKPNDLEVINPSTEEAFATISLGSKEDTNSAVSAAKQALVTWSESSKEDRINLLEKLLDIYQKMKFLNQWAQDILLLHLLKLLEQKIATL